MKPTLDPSIAAPTAQQVFDAVVTHLGAQREKCRPGTAGLGCSYRDLTWEKACGVGGLLTDDECRIVDKNSLLSSGVDALFDAHIIPPRLAPYQQLLEDLQHVHDIDPVQAWPDRLTKVGTGHGLKTDEIAGAFA